jgi:hypothetical protein
MRVSVISFAGILKKHLRVSRYPRYNLSMSARGGRPSAVQSRTTRQFWRWFSELPLGAQRDAKRAYRLFQSNPAHPGLQFKKLEGEDNIYSVRIGLEYRALAVRRNDRIVWYWIGSHSEYDRLV